MRRSALALPALLALGATFGVTAAVAQPTLPVTYPDSKTVDQTDDYHGTAVADPYRWLEDLDAPETKAWVEAQNEVTFGFLEGIPQREAIRERLTALWNYERYGVPTVRGTGDDARYFFFKNDGLQNQSVLYKQTGLGGDPEVLLDPNTLSADGTVALSLVSYSDDGARLAYGVSEAGSDWVTIRVRDVASGEDLADEVRWVKFSGAAWDGRGEGFYYARYDAPEEGSAFEAENRFQKLYYHALGTEQADDVLVYERPDDADLGVGASVTDDGRYLVVGTWKGTDPKGGLYVKDLMAEANGEAAPVVELFPAGVADFRVVHNEGSTFFVLTDHEAPNKRIARFDLANPEQMTTLVPESAAVIADAEVVGGKLVVEAMEDVKSRLTVHGMDGALLRTVSLPAPGSVSGLSGQADGDELFYAFSSFTYPTTIFRADVATGEGGVFQVPEVDFDPDAFEAKQVFYTSKDGTRVPLFIVHKKGLALDGSNPTLLYAYGGFNVNITPSFSTANVAWLEMGGVYAVPNLRGGGEYGEAWHEAGMLDKKQNVFDDFIAAAEYLIEEDYTRPEKLAVFGGSNGGLLVGAVTAQRPELFGAAIPAVGVMDMLRFHQFTIGWAWVPEYGSSDDPAQFETLYAYSPLHNLRDGTAYPATMVTTADTDDRVVPSHSFKYAARLQAAQGSDRPALIRIETRAGHGAGKPTAKQIEEAADRWAFLTWALDASADGLGSASGMGGASSSSVGASGGEEKDETCGPQPLTQEELDAIYGDG